MKLACQHEGEEIMTRREQWVCLLGGVDRVLVGIAGLLALTAVLWAGGLHMGNLGEWATGLFMLVLATWLGAATIAGAAMIPIWIVIRANRHCQK